MIPSIILHLVWCLAIVVCFTACQRNEVSEHSNTQVASAQIRYNPDDYPATTMQVTGVHAQRVQNLSLLCKVWGFLKYYHPNAARTDVYWDGRLLDMIERVPEWKNDSIRDADLEQLVVGLGAFSVNNTEGALPDTMVALEADLKWIDSSSISSTLRGLLHKVEHARRDTCSKYMVPDSVTFAFNGEIATPPSCLRKVGYRLLALFRFWNGVHYLFPYRTMMDRPWEEALPSFIPRIAESDSTLLFEKAILELSTWLCDSHVYVSGYQLNLASMFGNTELCMDVKFIRSKAYVASDWNDAFSDSKIKRGDEVLAISGKSVPSIVDSSKRYLPTSNTSTLYRDVAKLIVRTDLPSVNVLVRRGARTLTVPVYSQAHGPSPVSVRRGRFFRRVGTGNYGLIDMHLYSVDSLKAYDRELRACDGLIVDLRGGDGIVGQRELGTFFLPWPSLPAIFAIADWKRPGLFIYTSIPQVFGDTTDGHYKGKLVIMVDENTQSSLEYTAMILASAPGAVVIGSQTAGADGNIKRLQLPGGGILTFTGIAVFYPDGGVTQRTGLRIAKVVNDTRKSLTSDQTDEVLDEAMRLVRRK
ncbi:MAG: hypothetical protein IPP80_09560 [Ignavibacteria bacterium]|nr:hypothetical protein [Ignavibacteria bacterium]